MSSFERELGLARSIALEAAALVRTFTGRKLRIDVKMGNEPVTEADLAANELIVTRLAAAFPGDAILSEELPDTGARLGAARVWMVDPIDGTRDFILGEPGFAVMIGLCVDGVPMVGVVSQPIVQKTYGGVVGGSAWMENADGHRTALETSPLSVPEGIRLVASKSHRTSGVEAIKRALGIEDEMNMGSVGLKIGLVAEATRDLYVYTGGRTKLWDTCGPEAILRAAGGQMTDLDGSPLDYVGPDLHNRRGIVASNGHLHDHVIGAIRDLVPALIRPSA